jgi:hypothetical protein
MTDKQLRTTALFATARIALAAALACGAFAAQAQSDGQGAASSPYYIGASLGYTHDSNVYRTPDNFTDANGPHTFHVDGDNITSAGLLAGIDQPFGRQHFYANGNVHYNRFSSHDDLNNTSYGLTTGLDWSAMERLSGKFSYLLNNELATYDSGTGIVDFRQKNLQKTQDFDATVKYGLVSLLTLEGDYGHRQIDYSASAYQLYDYSQDAGSVGLKYHPSDLLTLGVDLRHTQGHYPDRTAPLDKHRNDLDLLATWVATGESTVNARLSYSKQTYDQDAGPSFKGTTGSISWAYQPTGKLRFVTSYAHDTGEEVGYNFGVTPVGPLLGDFSSISNSLQFEARYELTSKIQLVGKAGLLRRTLDSAITESESGHDELHTASLQANWDVTRSVSLGCSWTHEQRSSSVPALVPTTVTYPYGDNTYGCSAQVLLR